MGRLARLVGAVAIACFVAGAGLAATYAVTAERIVAQQKEAERRSLQAVLPAATSFTPLPDENLTAAREVVGDTAKVDVILRAEDPGGSFVGWGLKMQSRGYGGFMQVVVGMDGDGKVSGVRILQMNETPGLGTQVGEESFLGQFTSWSGPSVDRDSKELDSISGATKSSRGVAKGVVAAGHVYAEVLRSTGGEVE